MKRYQQYSMTKAEKWMSKVSDIIITMGNKIYKNLEIFR